MVAPQTSETIIMGDVATIDGRWVVQLRPDGRTERWLSVRAGDPLIPLRRDTRSGDDER